MRLSIESDSDVPNLKRGQDVGKVAVESDGTKRFAIPVWIGGGEPAGSNDSS